VASDADRPRLYSYSLAFPGSHDEGRSIDARLTRALHRTSEPPRAEVEYQPLEICRAMAMTERPTGESPTESRCSPGWGTLLDLLRR